MRINQINSYQKFGRALSANEMKQYKQLVHDAKQELGIQDTTAIVFDFNVPSEKGYNTAIGTTFSDSAKPFTAFIQNLSGINSIQLQPQGKISSENTSPYSGTNYAFGEHLIDLKKLTTDEYACLLTKQDIENADRLYSGDKELREIQTDYGYILGTDSKEGIQNQLLFKAFSTFNTAVGNSEQKAAVLNREFSDFKKENSDWLEKNALYSVLSQKYKTEDFRQWDEPDKSLFSENTSAEIRQSRIEQLHNDYGIMFDFENFKQFIADKQQKESKNSYNSQNIQLYGDCLIGFSQGEMWADIDCFRDNLYYGGPDPNCPETNGIQTWGLPALDYSQLGECNQAGDISKLGKAGKLLYDKYQHFFKRYDGIRVDAAWQFVTPFIYQAVNGNYEEVKFPEINYTILNIMKSAAQNASRKIDNDKIMLELVGLSAGRSRELTLNTYPHLYTTAYAEYDECPAKFIEKGYNQGNFYVGVGCHDNDSMINMAKDEYKRNLHYEGIKRNYDFSGESLSFDTKEYQEQTEAEKSEENFRNAKFAEIFTSAKQFFTLPDFFGMHQRINISGKADKSNWSVRIPSDYEKFYYQNLSQGKGINIPKALENAMIMRHINNPKLISKCREAAEILRQSGPMTTKEATAEEQNGTLNHKFAYNG